jgi:hypothetical protein
MNTAQAAGQIGLIDPETGDLFGQNAGSGTSSQLRGPPVSELEDRQFRIYRRGYPSLADNLRGRATHGQKSRSA